MSSVDPTAPAEVGRTLTPHTAERLLNPHFFFAEMQFIFALMDIGERMVAVPRETRRTQTLVPAHREDPPASAARAGF